MWPFLRSRPHLAAAAALTLALSSPAAAETVLRIGMTAADVPRTSGQPDQGGEGYRFSGYTMYDALVNWDLSAADRASGLTLGLATEWAISPTDRTTWILKLRPNVRFHDGAPFNADAVVWNARKVLDRTAPWFDAAQAGVTVSRMAMVTGIRKIDDMTVAVTTNEPDSITPYGLTNLLMASPTHWQKLYDAVPAEVTDPADRARRAWAAFASNASGTGPWRMTRLVPRERLELAANRDYWDPARRPKADRMVLLPLPDANARTAALLTGQVDWIEAPAPDALTQLRQRGFTISQNQIPHVWPWQFSFAEGSPWRDRRVRQAANLCVDRTAMKELLGGLMVEARGVYPPGHP
jgi:ABC-type transport system substrate-binding protein